MFFFLHFTDADMYKTIEDQKKNHFPEATSKH